MAKRGITVEVIMLSAKTTPITNFWNCAQGLLGLVVMLPGASVIFARSGMIQVNFITHLMGKCTFTGPVMLNMN
jgi:hypothetical protein